VEKRVQAPARPVLEVDDRRQHQRIEPAGATVELTLEGQTRRFDIDNLSEGGALIHGRIEVPLGTSVRLTIALPDLAPIPIQARVLRHMLRGGKDHTALVFAESSDDLRDWIGEVVLRALHAAFPAP
jgi:hypothetical protein